MDLAVTVGILHAVIDGVFQNRLDDELDGIQLLHPRLHGNVGRELILIAHFLDGQIVPGMLDLVPDGNDVAALAERDPEKPGQRRQHDHSLLCPAVLRHPHHAVQGVVQEVRIDLGLQHIQLAAALFLLLTENILHQVPHGGDHGLHGMAQMLHLIGAVHIEVNGLHALFQLSHRMIQFFHRCCDPFRKPQVHEYQQKDGEGHYKQGKQQKLTVIVPQRLRRHHAHQLPAGVAHCFHRHLPALGVENLRMRPVGIPGGRQVVFLLQARIEKLLTGVVDDLSVSVDQVEITLPVEKGYILADLLNAAEVHIHQQHAALDHAAPGQLHMAAEGHHPMIPRVGVLKHVLHMRRGKMQVFNALHGGGEPPLTAGRHAVFQFCQGRGGDQLAVPIKHRQRHQYIPVLGVQQLQSVAQLLRRVTLLQIRALDDPVVHRVGYPHHVPQIAVQIPVHLCQHTLAALRRHLVGGGGKAQQQRHPQKQHSNHGHRRKGDGQDQLNTGMVIPRFPPCFKAGRFLIHRWLLSPSVTYPRCGTSSVSRRNAS